MATVKRQSLTTSSSMWDSFFNGLNCPLISASGGTVDIDGKFSLRLSGQTVYFYKGSSQLVGSTYNFPMVVTVCCNDSFVSIQLKDPQSRRIVLVYEKLEGLDVYATAGGGNNSGTAFFSINSLTFTDNETALTYAHKARLNYADGLGYIDYTDEVLFDSNNHKTDIEDPNFVACSTVPADQVITFQGKNYYSIGANTLVLIDD